MNAYKVQANRETIQSVIESMGVLLLTVVRVSERRSCERKIFENRTDMLVSQTLSFTCPPPHLIKVKDDYNGF